MRRRTGTAYAFLSPYLLVFAAFWVWPILYSFWLSFLATRQPPWTFRPSMTWGRLAPDRALMQRAFSLDAVAEELLFVSGPLLVGVLGDAGLRPGNQCR